MLCDAGFSILARLAGPNGGERVPVVGQRHRDRVHRGIGEHAPHVGVLLGFGVALPDHVRRAPLERGLIDITQRCDLGAGSGHVEIHVVFAAASQADDSDLYAVVRTHYVGCLRRGQGHPRGEDKMPSANRCNAHGCIDLSL